MDDLGTKGQDRPEEESAHEAVEGAGNAPEAAKPVAESPPVEEAAGIEGSGEAVADRATSEGAEPRESADGQADKGAGARAETDRMQWYVLKVQSGREGSIRESLLKRIAIAGLEDQFGEIIIPTEKISEIKGGKKRVSERKLYPGYMMIQMDLTEESWFLVRETPHVGDFTGAGGRPIPMAPHEVEKMLGRESAKEEESPKVKIRYKPGDSVKIKEGTFSGFEGTVETIDEANGRVTVLIKIFGRSAPVELGYWEVEGV